MKRLIAFLETDETLLRASMLGMLIYAVHNSIIVFNIEHMPFELKVTFSVAAAFITEFIALVLFIHGKVMFGRVYATCLYFMGNWYYWYFMAAPKDWSLIMVSWLFNTIHYAASLYLSEIFYHRRQNRSRNEPDDEELTLIVKDENVRKTSGTSGLECQPAKPEEEFRCHVCDRSFSRKFTLERHLVNVHALDKSA